MDATPPSPAAPTTWPDYEPRLGWFHRYPARFAAPVVGQLLSDLVERLGGRPARLLDPYAGTGATMAAARQAGIPSEGVELGRLGVLISTVRLAPPRDLEAALDQAEGLARLQPAVDGRHPHRAELERWMGPRNVDQLVAVLTTIESIPDSATRAFCELTLSAALRPASVWLAGSIKPQVDPSRSPRPLANELARCARTIARDVRCETLGASVPARVVQGNAARLPFEDGAFDAVITSPPYFTTYDYIDVQRLSYLAFRWPNPRDDQLGRYSRIPSDGVCFIPPNTLADWYELYGREKTAKGRAIRDYAQRLALHLSEVHRVTRPGAAIGVAMANSVRAGRTFDLVATLGELMSAAGFTSIEIRNRSARGRRILPLGRNVTTGRFADVPTGGTVERLVYATRL